MRGTIIQDAFLLYWSHSHFITLLLVIFLLLCLKRASRTHSAGSAIARLSSTYWVAFDTALIALAVAHCGFYLSVPNFTDFVEPMIPLLANNYLQGAPIYADWNAGHAIVGSLYGPYVFLAQLPVLLWHPTIIASKSVGIFFGLGSVLLLFLAVHNRIRSFKGALTLCALMVSMFSFQLHSWFWNRPDSGLIAVASLSALLFDRIRPAMALIGLGLLAGVMINLKIYGILYILPLAIACIPAVLSRSAVAHSATVWSATARSGLAWSKLAGAVAVSGGLFLAALALPFALGVESFWPYIVNLSMMPNQGFDFAGCTEAAFYGILILALPLVTWRTRRIQREDRVMAFALIVCTALTAVMAGNPGGGPLYMMPLVPSALYLTARMWGRPSLIQPVETATCRLVLCAVVIGAAPIWTYSWFQMAKQAVNVQQEQAKAAELRELFAAFPNSEMGHNDGTITDPDEFYRVEKAFLGQITRFDYVNYTDQRAAGVPASILYPLFDKCNIPGWILARQGDRFLGTTWDRQLRLLDEGALKRFYANYRLAGDYRFYEVWRCNREFEAGSRPGIDHVGRNPN